MATKYAFENLLRTPWEFLVSFVALGFGLLVLSDHQVMAIDIHMAPIVAVPFFLLALWRFHQGRIIWRFRKALLTLKPFSMSTEEVPVSKKYQYIGQGFEWLPIHHQRLSLLNTPQNQRFLRHNAIYRFVQKRAKENEKGLCHVLTQLGVFKPPSPIGGKPWIHGVGSESEGKVLLSQSNRSRHEVVFGMTQVGKTRFLTTKVNQDIRNGDAVAVIDPKGDKESAQDIYLAAKSAGRLNDLVMIHFGFPEISARYNPVGAFSDVSEVADRIAGAIDGSGEGAAFRDFAWDHINIVARCLNEMGEGITYKSISFYLFRPTLLLAKYADHVFADKEPRFKIEVNKIILASKGRMDKAGNDLPPLERDEAIVQWVGAYIKEKVMSGEDDALRDSVLAPLYKAGSMDETYYTKITSSAGPVLNKINQTQAGSIFSPGDDAMPGITLEQIIKEKKIVYIGMDSLSNESVANAVGQAIISDLVSLCGRLYNRGERADLCLHCDEFSNIVRDEFVNLLNKAGGAGIKVTAYTQTVNDLGAAFGSNKDKAKMLLGNFGTKTALQLANSDTAELFTDCVQETRTRSSTPSTMSNDRADNNGALFTTYNTDTINEESTPVISANDLFSLPKGQAFVMTDGGKLFKIRIPLPKNNGQAPESFESLLKEVNQC